MAKKILTAILVLLLLAAASSALADYAAPLTLTLLPDGSGYEITDCDNKETVFIPASHNGLPVKSISPDAFQNNLSLKRFIADKRSEYFYAQDGVLFTDEPVKTLVRYPSGEVMDKFYYVVPEDTVAIGSYAFAHVTLLESLYLPEGLTTLNDYAFAKSDGQITVVIPDSLTQFGKNLFQGQRGNVIWEVKPGSEAERVARSFRVPTYVKSDREPDEMTAVFTEPDLEDAEDAPEVDPAGIVTAFAAGDPYHFYTGLPLMIHLDLTAQEEGRPSEVRVKLDNRWPRIQPNQDGETESGFPAQDGLYGSGFTQGTAWLRGYDADGNVTGVRRVSGDFAFALPGASNLGISGGEGTKLCVIPYEPVYVSEPGIFPLSQEQMHPEPYGCLFQYYVFMINDAEYNMLFPEHMNVITQALRGPGTAGVEALELSPGYGILYLEVRDPVRAADLNQVSIEVDGLETIFENDEFCFKAAKRYKAKKDYGEKLYAIFRTVKEVMLENYYPPDAPVPKVTVLLNGCYPCADGTTVYLDDYYATWKPDNTLTLAHEMVHAIDSAYEPQPFFGTQPMCWREGRAEYISEKVCQRMKVRYSAYQARYDWSFLTAEDKADFRTYFRDNFNRQTPYPVGYYFMKFISQTYGEDTAGRIMSAMPYTGGPGHYISFERSGEAVVETICSVTEENVFQRFVEEVIR